MCVTLIAGLPHLYVDIAELADDEYIYHVEMHARAVYLVYSAPSRLSHARSPSVHSDGAFTPVASV